MKLCFVSLVLLLSPIVVLAKPPPPAPVKIVYDSQYVISESFDAREISYSVGGWRPQLIFHTRQNTSNNNGELMVVDIGAKSLNELKAANLSFVVESRSPFPENDEKEKLEDRFCYRNSDESLRRLIFDCTQGMVLRKLRVEESFDMQLFRRSYRGDLHGLFEVSYDRGQITSHSQFLDSFSVGSGFLSLPQLWVSTSDVLGGQREMSVVNYEGHQKGSFVIESIPRAGNLNCLDSRRARMIVSCKGSIYLRSY